MLQELDFLFEPLPEGFELLLLLGSDLLGHDLEIDVLLLLRFRDLLFFDRNRSIRTQIYDHRLMTGIKILVHKLGKDNSGCEGFIPNYKDCTSRRWLKEPDTMKPTRLLRIRQELICHLNSTYRPP